jgi:hypothetical protein
MTFTTVVFGSGVVNAPGNITYTDGGNISSGGFRLFLVPTRNVGAAGIDIGFTYVNQFGVTRTTTVSTAIAAGTTSGTHIQVVLEPGDTGIRDIVSISYFAGGTAGDRINFESQNEGLGRPPLGMSNTEPFDRTVPGSHIFEEYIGQWKGIDYPFISIIPVPWYENPSMPIPMEMMKSTITDWISDLIIDRATIAKTFNIADKPEIIAWIPEPYSGRDFQGKNIFFFKSWLESVVGQVLSGYVQNVNGETIKNAFSMILMSPATDVNPAGVTTTSDVNPDTGLYQMFLKKLIYNERYVIVKIGVKNIALEGAGIPTIVDGNQQLPIPYNLQFACPVKDCDFTITRKII